MPDNSAAIVIDIGTTNCKVTCFSCLDATTLGAHKFVTAKQISPQGDVDFDIDALWQEVRQAIDLSESTLYPVLRRLQKDGCLEVYDMEFGGRNRRYYRITERGSAQLSLYEAEWIRYSEKITALFEGGQN